MGRITLSDPRNRCRRPHLGRYGNSQSYWIRDKLYLPFAQHTTPARLQPFRVSLRKVLWWIFTLEVLWRSLVLALMPDPRFPLRMLFATPTSWAPTSTMPARLPLSFFRWPLANTRFLVILLLGPLQISYRMPLLPLWWTTLPLITIETAYSSHQIPYQ
jgi:hypothetical protein